jgi:hypothetical protein
MEEGSGRVVEWRSGVMEWCRGWVEGWKDGRMGGWKSERVEFEVRRSGFFLTTDH